MSIWSSSSLSFSEPRHSGSGLLKHNPGISKQADMERRMFRNKSGSHGKDFQIGKKFGLNRRAKGSSKLTASKFSGGEFTSGGVSPSPEEFDKMLGSSVIHNMNKKRTPISKKFFG